MLGPAGSVSLWHGAIQKDLKEILEDLHQIRSSNNQTDLASVIIQLQFIADLMNFYREALDKVVYPVLKEVAGDPLSISGGHLFSESRINGLKKSLCYNSKNGVPLRKFVERLYCEVQSFLMEVTKQFTFHEREVFPLIVEKCNDSAQRRLLYTSLQTVPLGLLKCVITWFASHLSEDQSIFILGSIKDGSHLIDQSFTSLLLEWIRTGYSGKTSVENFRKDLQNMFGTKCFVLSDQIKRDTGSSSVHRINAQSVPANNATDIEFEPNSSSSSQTSEMDDTPIHLLVVEKDGDSDEARPVDHILFYHRALKKDLEYLVFGSAQLAEDLAVLESFRHRFRLVKLLYQNHSDAEDEFAFPALKEKGYKCKNISNSYSIDHKMEADHFAYSTLILDEISELHGSICSDSVDEEDQKMVKYRQLCTKLHDMSKTMCKILCDHMDHEEIELWPLFEQSLSDQEQEKIIGYMLGRTRAEVLEEMIPWLMACLTQEEQQALMFLWRKATKNTMFEEWLQEWWVGVKRCTISTTTEELNTISLSNSAMDPLELISTYLSKEGLSDLAGTLLDKDAKYDFEQSGIQYEQDKGKNSEEDEHNHQLSQSTEQFCESEMENGKYVKGQIDKPGQELNLLSMSQEDLEAIIRRISRDPSLDSRQKSSMIQSLLTRQWMVKQQKTSEAKVVNADEVLGRSPSYRDLDKLSFGCEHYKRNCKLLAACCNQLYACRNCHDEVEDHSMDRKATVEMMCMKCLIVQPIGPRCSSASCDDLSMAKYYCRICKLFDDLRDIYHCPYCNICRVGKGLGIDFFHCMNCNACMSPSLSVHVCREKSFEDKCPICHEDIFTSSTPVKALPCGHMMHSACFQDYTCTHYTCPMCSKSLGDMQVYFGMLDALLAEEKIPDEYSGRTQIVLCNDCEKRGSAPYHWLHHKCPFCGSYNTRLL